MDAAPLLAHILSQTKQNIEFLVAQKQISQDDARDILLKLPKSPSITEAALVQQTRNLTVTDAFPSLQNTIITPPYTSSPAGIPYEPPPAASTPIGTVLFRAKAAWDYNENGQNPADLSFRAGDVFDIMAETNADWWTGRHNGREGLFPSNYVERIPQTQGVLTSPAPSSSSEKPTPAASLGYAMAPASSSYQSPGSYQGPPPPGQAYTHYGGPPPLALPGQTPPAGPNLPADNQNPPKKGMFGGKFGNTLAHSAAGGVGFGAGSAIGSGVINSLF